MKILLTEQNLQDIVSSSIKQILEDKSLYDYVLCESIINLGGLKNIKKNIKKAILCGVSIVALISAIHNLNVSIKEQDKLIDFAKIEMQRLHDEDSIFNAKVNACRDYMEKALINNGYSVTSTKLKPETLVRASQKTGFDLPFLLAAAHQESCFGATPRSHRTNSVFSVGSYDDGRNVVNYSDPNESVEDYIRLLKKDYLVNGKTINDLLKPNSFVNFDGKRYAQDRKYEQRINSIRNRIIKNYPELIQNQ